MADFNISGNMRVGTLQKQFKEAFGASLRVYKGKNFADDDATLASIRVSDDVTKSAEFSVKGSMHVSEFEDKIKEEFGITVQVATPDNSKLAKNDITLIDSGK